MGTEDDDWEVFRELKRQRQQKRSKRAQQADTRIDELRALIAPIPLVVHPGPHWQIKLPTGLIDYWPSGARWRYQNKARFGDMNSFMGWIKKEMNRAPQTEKAVSPNK